MLADGGSIPPASTRFSTKAVLNGPANQEKSRFPAFFFALAVLIMPLQAGGFPLDGLVHRYSGNPTRAMTRNPKMNRASSTAPTTNDRVFVALDNCTKRVLGNNRLANARAITRNAHSQKVAAADMDE